MSKAVSGLDSLTTLGSHDLLYVVATPDVVPASKKVSVWRFLGMIPANTHLLQSLTVDGNTAFNGPRNVFNGNTTVHGITTVRELVVANTVFRVSQEHSTPANSTATTIAAGTMFWDSGYLYVATANNVVKRSTLSAF
jgi:hypothetical protein